MNILQLLNRKEKLFTEDIRSNEQNLDELIHKSKILVIGGAGTIGKATTIEIFKRNPRVLHVVDISENNMVELVRDIRSSIGYLNTDFRTFAIDCGSSIFNQLIECEGPYDYVFNLSALKHVRSEKDPFTLMRMIEVNILNTLKTLKATRSSDTKKYFCVSTDKATNPVNMMGASKRIMELFLLRESVISKISMARFANVAFSDGSLLHGFNQRIERNQPIAAPLDIKRYFITPSESGELCLLSGILGDNKQIFFPKLDSGLHLIRFSDIAIKYLESKGFEPYKCSNEDEARSKSKELIAERKWPCYFFESDTTGEKDFEEFYKDDEVIDMTKFMNIGIINYKNSYDELELEAFLKKITDLRKNGQWKKQEIVELFNRILPEFNHIDKGKDLDQKM